MRIGGWKTRSVFERYAIVSRSDIADAMLKLELRKGSRRKRQKRKLVTNWSRCPAYPRALRSRAYGAYAAST